MEVKMPEKERFLIRHTEGMLVVSESTEVVRTGEEQSPGSLTCRGRQLFCRRYGDGTVSEVQIQSWWTIENKMAFAHDLVREHLAPSTWHNALRADLSSKLQGILRLDP
jgi:hypothetical protein